jgi:hypothetical protein
LAKFTNLESSPYGFSSGPAPDKSGGGAPVGMKPNASFDQETNSIIMGSKMNQPDPWDSDAIQY